MWVRAGRQTPLKTDSQMPFPFVNPAGTKALGAYRGNHFFAASVWHRNDIPNSVFWAVLSSCSDFLHIFFLLACQIHLMSWALPEIRQYGEPVATSWNFFFVVGLVDSFIVQGHSETQYPNVPIMTEPLLSGRAHCWPQLLTTKTWWAIHYIFASTPPQPLASPSESFGTSALP